MLPVHRKFSRVLLARVQERSGRSCEMDGGQEDVLKLDLNEKIVMWVLDRVQDSMRKDKLHV